MKKTVKTTCNKTPFLFEVAGWKTEAKSYRDRPDFMENYKTLNTALAAARKLDMGYIEVTKNEYCDDGSLDVGWMVDVIRKEKNGLGR